MYAYTIIETDTAVQARIARIFLEAAGYPTIAATVRVEGHEGHIAITSAPEGEPQRFEYVINLYARRGEAGVRYAAKVVEEPEARLLASRNTLAVPTELRDTVRNALLHTLYTAVEAEHATVVTSEPSYSTLSNGVPEAVDDEDSATTKPVHNPAGGGFDGECRGADQWRPHFAA
jgi:hypothetical protein